MYRSLSNRNVRLTRIQRLIEPNEQLVAEAPDQAETPRLKTERVEPKLNVLCDANNGIFVPPGKGARPTILILWTPAARIWLTSQGRQVSSEIQLVMDTMQFAMQGLWFSVYPRLVASQEINYKETGPTLDSDLNILTRGQIPGVLQMRNQMRADLVMLIGYYPNAGACSLAWVKDKAASANIADYGYSVVNVDVSGSSYCYLTVSGVHEVGHNFGMRHDRPNGGNSRLDYNYGVQ